MEKQQVINIKCPNCGERIKKSFALGEEKKQKEKTTAKKKAGGKE